MSPSVVAVGALIAAMLSFQVGASVAKQLMPLIGAPGTTALRIGISAVLLCMVRRPWRAWPPRRHIPLLVAYGVSLGTMNFVFYEAIKRIPLGIAVGLEFTGPLGVALLGSRRRLDIVWLTLAVAGVLLLLPLSRTSGSLNRAGVLFALTAGACWALYIVFGQRAGHALGNAAPTWGMLVAAVEIVPLGLADAGTAMLAPAVLPLGIAVAVMSSALPYTLEMVALRRLTAKTYGTLVSLEPALAALAGLVLLGERLTHLQWLGIGAVIFASIGTLGDEPTSDQVP